MWMQFLLHSEPNLGFTVGAGHSYIIIIAEGFDLNITSTHTKTTILDFAFFVHFSVIESYENEIDLN